MIVTPHLQAYYRFENNGLDSSGKDNHLTAVGATYGAGKVGNDAIYDGVDDRHDGGNILNLGLDSWFISLWVKPERLTGNFAILQKSKNALGIRYNIYCSEGLYFFTIDSSYVAMYFTISTSLTPINKWTNIMWNIDRSGLSKGYVNLIERGSVDISSSLGTNMSSTLSFLLGCFTKSDGITPQDFFKGQIDEVLMYNKTMNETDRKRIYCGLHPLNG